MFSDAIKYVICLQEIVPVSVPGKRGQPAVEVKEDEALAKMDVGRLRGLRPAFSKGAGASVTAGNSSPITDGAAALVLMSSEKAAQLGLKVPPHLLSHLVSRLKSTQKKLLRWTLWVVFRVSAFALWLYLCLSTPDIPRYCDASNLGVTCHWYWMPRLPHYLGLLRRDLGW